MKKLFLLIIAYVACELFPAEIIIAPTQRGVAASVRGTAQEFAHFVERAQQFPFTTKVCAKIADQLIRSCIFEGHYVEANPDLVNQKAYFSVLYDDYFPLFEALRVFDRDQSYISANALFDCMLDIYTRNLRDQVDAARKSHEDDVNFSHVNLTKGEWYEANGIDFFRNPTFLSTYEAFVGKTEIRGLTRDHTSILKKKRTALLRIKETQVEYRQHVEDHLNQLLYMTWRCITDRNSLSSRTKAILANLPYVHKILKQGQCEDLNYDVLITDSITNPDNQLHRVFAIMQGAPVAETSLPKALLPNKKKIRKKKPATAVPTSSSSAVPAPSASHQPASDDDDVEEVDIPDATLAATPAPEPMPAHTDSGKDEVADTTLAATPAPEPMPTSPVVSPVLYQMTDWLNGRPVTLVYDLCRLVTDVQQRSANVNDTRSIDVRARNVLILLSTFQEDKFVRYEAVQALYAALGGQIVNQKGSHETWVFHEGANKVKTSFFRNHDKDQYGPWTKLDVKQVIADVLKPFLIQLQ